MSWMTEKLSEYIRRARALKNRSSIKYILLYAINLGRQSPRPRDSSIFFATGSQESVQLQIVECSCDSKTQNPRWLDDQERALQIEYLAIIRKLRDPRSRKAAQLSIEGLDTWKEAVNRHDVREIALLCTFRLCVRYRFLRLRLETHYQSPRILGKKDLFGQGWCSPCFNRLIKKSGGSYSSTFRRRRRWHASTKHELQDQPAHAVNTSVVTKETVSRKRISSQEIIFYVEHIGTPSGTFVRLFTSDNWGSLSKEFPSVS
jgi:hypothetical protein